MLNYVNLMRRAVGVVLMRRAVGAVLMIRVVGAVPTRFGLIGGLPLRT